MRVPWRNRLVLLGVLLVLLGCTAAATETGSGSGDDRQDTETTTTSVLPMRLTYRRGDVGPGGGFVFYVSRNPFPCGPDLSALCNYLEAAPFVDEVARSWSGPAGGDETAAGTAIGSGHRNTRIVAERGTDDPDRSAVAYADAYERNGYIDWYLPSLDECHELTIARELIGGFTFGVYWTSTERDATSAWYQHFMNSFQFPESKSTQHRVRPIRAF